MQNGIKLYSINDLLLLNNNKNLFTSNTYYFEYSNVVGIIFKQIYLFNQ